MKMENPSPRDLLAYATATAPTQLLSEHAVNVLMDVVPDFETLARAGGVCGGGSDGSTGRANEGAGGGSHETDADGSGVSRKLKERINDELKGLVDEDELKGMWEFWGSEWVVE